MPKKAATAVVRQRTADAVERSPKPRKVARSAKSGEIIAPSAAAADPDGSITQEVMSPLDTFITKFKLPKPPKNPGAMADLLYLAREDRLRLQKIVDQIESLEKDLKAHFIDNLSKKDSTGVAGKRARVQIVTEDVPQVEDWEATYAYIKKKGEFDLLNRALNKAAVKARWEAKKEVPGVRHFTVSKVSVTKV